MKKNIAITVLTIMMLLSFMYAFAQRAEAERQHQNAKDSEQRANEAYMQTMECKQMAQQLQDAMAGALAATEAQKEIAAKAVADAKKK